MWRPDNWEKVKPKSLDKDEDWRDIFDSGVEAGADAMLKGLFKLAKESPTKAFTIDSRVINIYKEADNG